MRTLASIAALNGVTEFDAACVDLLDIIYAALDQQAVQVGLLPNALFNEKVEILQRKYNTALNPPLADHVDGAFTKEYRRQTQGY